MSKRQNWAVALLITAAFFAGYCSREFSRIDAKRISAKADDSKVSRIENRFRTIRASMKNAEAPGLNWEFYNRPVLMASKSSLLTIKNPKDKPIDINSINGLDIVMTYKSLNQELILKTTVPKASIKNYIKQHYNNGIPTPNFSVIIPPINAVPKIGLNDEHDAGPINIINKSGVIQTIRFRRKAQVADAMGTGTGTVTVTVTTNTGVGTIGPVEVEIIEYDPCADAQPAPVQAPAQGM
jgi:hypothetical protein